MTMETKLQEIFQTCLTEVDNDKKRAAHRFIVKAKREFQDVTTQDCMKVLGMYSEDESRMKAYEQTFRLTIFNPVRDKIAKVSFNADPEQIFGRTVKAMTDEQKTARLKTRKSVLSQLPTASRAKSGKDLDYIDDLLTE